MSSVGTLNDLHYHSDLEYNTFKPPEAPPLDEASNPRIVFHRI
jgi:hypothetical protein